MQPHISTGLDSRERFRILGSWLRVFFTNQTTGLVRWFRLARSYRSASCDQAIRTVFQAFALLFIFRSLEEADQTLLQSDLQIQQPAPPSLFLLVLFLKKLIKKFPVFYWTQIFIPRDSMFSQQVLVTVPVTWDVTLCSWVFNFRRFESLFETSNITHITTQHNIPQNTSISLQYAYFQSPMLENVICLWFIVIFPSQPALQSKLT